MSERICRAIAEPNATFSRGDTYNGHPASHAAALRNLEILLGVELAEDAARSDEHLQRRAQELSHLPHMGNVRGVGLKPREDLAADEKTRAPFALAPHVPEQARDEADDRGLSCRSLRESIALAPPLIATESQIDDILDTLPAAILAVVGG